MNKKINNNNKKKKCLISVYTNITIKFEFQYISDLKKYTNFTVKFAVENRVQLAS